jgi:serine/threonine protein kinase
MTNFFFNKIQWKSHLKCQNKVISNGNLLVPVHGITQDPDTKNYMVAMLYFPSGSLRNNLPMIKSNPNDKFSILYYISVQLEGIHKLGFVHGDFHSGNVLYLPDGYATICDLGLCRPIEQYNTEEEIYGIVPYMAPEVLRRNKSYTKAADIYSFGIIMWELASGVPAYNNIPHDLHLTLDICEGKRPEIKEGTMPEEYEELMKECWDNDPEKRPTAKKLRLTFMEWIKKYPLEDDEEKRLPVPGNNALYNFYCKIYFLLHYFADYFY